MQYSSLEGMLGTWEQSTRKRSGNLTTNDFLPADIKQKLLEEDLRFGEYFDLEELSFPSLGQGLHFIEGMDILSGLQKLHKKGNVTLFRAIRFPTAKRIWRTVHEDGLSTPNYEQERILRLYGNSEYATERRRIQQCPTFWTQPQERVVLGLPLFSLVNDALQIHHAYRGIQDRVLVIVAHIPLGLIEEDRLHLFTNAAIDMDYDNDEMDYKIKNFRNQDTIPTIDYRSLRCQGIDLHEMYIKNLPFNLEEHTRLGIEQRFFLVDIYETNQEIKRIGELSQKVLREHQYFLHGIFGDHNIFGRIPTKYLPSRCYEVKAKNIFSA